jgi:single-stranded DNA-specific DHH superfamily exonuclease
LTAANEDQGVERRTKHACKMAEDAGTPAMIIESSCWHESWHPGVVGIVCSRMVENCRLTVLRQKGRDLCKGSARSIDGTPFVMRALTAHLMTTCGH